MTGDFLTIATHLVVGFFGTVAGAGVAYKAVMAKVKGLELITDHHDKRIEKLEDARPEFVVQDFCLRMRGECQGRIFAELADIKTTISGNATILRDVQLKQQRVLEKLGLT